VHKEPVGASLRRDGRKGLADTARKAGFKGETNARQSPLEGRSRTTVGKNLCFLKNPTLGGGVAGSTGTVKVPGKHLVR